MLEARLLVFFAALLFSTGGAAIKSVSLTGWQVGGARAGIAAVAILLLIPTARKLFDWRILAAGVAYYGRQPAAADVAKIKAPQFNKFDSDGRKAY